MKLGNLFDGAPGVIRDEYFEDLLGNDAFRVERIVSVTPSLPAGQWYDQAWDEWVVLLKGSAGLRFEDEGEVLEMRPGDYLTIAAHRRHRVEWTDGNQRTVWLAVHYRPDSPAAE